MTKPDLDKEEKVILESFERGEWQSISAFQQESEKYRQYASRTLKKDKHVDKGSEDSRGKTKNKGSRIK